MSDEEWEVFAPFVAPSLPRKGRPAQDHRRVLDGIFWVARTGSPWRDLPDYFGKFGSVHRQFRRSSVSGLWDVILEAVNDTGDGPGQRSDDRQPHRSRPPALGGGKKRGPDQGLDRSRGGLSTKIHLTSNGLGLPVAAVLTGGQVNDVEAYALDHRAFNVTRIRRL